MWLRGLEVEATATKRVLEVEATVFDDGFGLAAPCKLLVGLSTLALVSSSLASASIYSLLFHNFVLLISRVYIIE